MWARRIGRPIVPKEHGAWAVIYGALIAGVGVAGRVTLPVLLFLFGVTAAAFANGPLALLVRPATRRPQEDQWRRASCWFLIYGAGALLGFIPLLVIYRMTFLLPYGAGAAAFLLLRMFLVREREDRTLVGELAGTAGLTMVGAAAHAVAVGEIQRTGAVLWLLLFLFFASGVFYVRMRVHGMFAHRKGEPSGLTQARWACVGYHALLLAAVPALTVVHLVPWPVLLAYGPALGRTAAGLRQRKADLNLRRLGWSEVALTVIFVSLLVAAFWIKPPSR